MEMGKTRKVENITLKEGRLKPERQKKKEKKIGASP